MGRKHIMGIWEGATENGAVCKSPLCDPVGRGLRVDQPFLVVMGGSKALAADVRDVLGRCAVVQPCRVHKVVRSVLEHLPQDAQPWVKRKLDQAYNITKPTTPPPSGSLPLPWGRSIRVPRPACGKISGRRSPLRLWLPELLSRSVPSTSVNSPNANWAATSHP